MSPELFSILVLVAIFVVASTLPINLGILAFAAAYITGAGVAGMAVEDIFLGFPGNLFVLLVGVTYLFAIAQTNGAVDWIVHAGMRLIRGRIALLPWLMFALTALLAAMGALAAAALACTAPIAMRFAARYNISSLMIGIMICIGSVGGSFSPISPFGVIVNGALDDGDLPTNPGLLMVNNLAFSVVLAAAVFLVMGGGKLWSRRIHPVAAGPDGGGAPIPSDVGDRTSGSPFASHHSGNPGTTTTDVDTEATTAGSEPITLAQVATFAGILTLVVGALVFELDVGLLAFIVAVPLSLFSTSKPAEVIKRVPWSVVLLVGGMLTYVGVLEEMGTLDYVADLINRGGSPLIAALLVCFMGALVSAFAATAGVLVATIPLVVPLLQSHDLSVIGVVTALCISSTIVDSSPMSTNGALLLANQQTTPERVFFRRLLVWAILTVTLGPLLAWGLFVVPTT